MVAIKILRIPISMSEIFPLKRNRIKDEASIEKFKLENRFTVYGFVVMFAFQCFVIVQTNQTKIQ
jgi:hypothetical protein